jgi:hypothetical protein
MYWPGRKFDFPTFISLWSCSVNMSLSGFLGSALAGQKAVLRWFAKGRESVGRLPQKRPSLDDKLYDEELKPEVQLNDRLKKLNERLEWLRYDHSRQAFIGDYASREGYENLTYAVLRLEKIALLFDQERRSRHVVIHRGIYVSPAKRF